MKSVPIVHIHYGSEENKQFAAGSQMGIYIVCIEDSDAIKSWTEDELVSWLLDCDMHLTLPPSSRNEV